MDWQLYQFSPYAEAFLPTLRSRVSRVRRGRRVEEDARGRGRGRNKGAGSFLDLVSHQRLESGYNVLTILDFRHFHSGRPILITPEQAPED